MSVFPRGEFWSSDFSTASGGVHLAKFAVGGGSSVFVAGVVIDDEAEPAPGVSGLRIHGSLYEGEYRLDSFARNSRLDVVVRRQFEFTGGFIEIVNDISIRREIRLGSMRVSPLRLSGGWDLLGVLIYDGKSNRPLWIENPPGYKSKNPFLAALFRTPDGRLAEIGTGDDLWRWMIAKGDENASSSFSIKKEGEEWLVERKILLFKDKGILRQRDIRLSWHLCFSDGDKRRHLAEGAMSGANFSLQGADCPDSAKISWKECLKGVPCLRANWSRAALKNFVRGLCGRKNCGRVFLSGIELPLCDSPSHLGRGDSKRLPHWNILEINKFRKWARRQLAPTGVSISLVPAPDSAAAKLAALH